MIKNYLLLLNRMSFKQLYYRFIKIIKFKVVYPKFGERIYPFRDIKRCHSSRSPLPFFAWDDFLKQPINTQYKQKIIHRASRVCENEFRFLNTSHKFKEKIEWQGTEKNDKLWYYYLNYFEYLLDLIECYFIVDDIKYINKAQQLIDEWIDFTIPGQTNSWEAYTISIRLIYWSYVWEVLEKENIEIYKGFKEKFITSIQQQSMFLFNNLEKDLANNHYTANGKALFWVGVSFPHIENAERYLRTGIKILHTQLVKEIKNDGSQYENSTSYQLMTAKDYLETLIYAEKNNIDLPKEFYYYTESMFDFIINLLKPDRTLPLLNDSVKDYPINERELLSLASVYFNRPEFKFGAGDIDLLFLSKIMGQSGYNNYVQTPEVPPSHKSILLRGSNYAVFRSGWEKSSKYLLFDAGEIGPRHNAGHAHADNLNIILHAYGEDIFIDPGTYEYDAGNKRDYYRSTRAHNTVEIEGQNQSTFWAPFRVGHFAKSKLIKFELTPNSEKISALHYGYQRLKQKLVHKRDVEWDKHNTWTIKDNVLGKGSTHGKIHFQIGKTCKGIKMLEKSCLLEFQDSVIKMKFFSSNEINIDLEDAYVSEGWKEEEKTKKVVVSFSGGLPIQVTTSLIILKKK